MPKLPITANITYSVSGDILTAAITLTDASGVNFANPQAEWHPSGGLVEALGQIRDSIREAVNTYLTLADLPTSFSVQIGLDTSLRNLDLL